MLSMNDVLESKVYAMANARSVYARNKEEPQWRKSRKMVLQ